MDKIQLLEMLTVQAKEYRKGASDSIGRNSHMNNATGSKIAQADIDALLADFINSVGMWHGIDYALYASDLDT